MRRRTTTILLILAMLLVPLAASAQESEVTLSGTGYLAARGTGEVVIDAEAKMRMAIDGDVHIQDLAGDLRVQIRSEAHRAAGNEPESLGGVEIELQDFNGVIWLQGSHFILEAEGSMRFAGKGSGTAYLSGEGIYRTRHGGWTPWPNGWIGVD